MMDRESRLPRLKVLMAPDTRAQFLQFKRQNMKWYLKHWLAITFDQTTASRQKKERNKVKERPVNWAAVERFHFPAVNQSRAAFQYNPLCVCVCSFYCVVDGACHLNIELVGLESRKNHILIFLFLFQPILEFYRKLLGDLPTAVNGVTMETVDLARSLKVAHTRSLTLLRRQRKNCWIHVYEWVVFHDH